MKHYLFAALLLPTLPALAQTTPSEAAQPFKGANLVITHTADSTRTALKSVVVLLQKNGFVVDHIDCELFSLSRKPHSFTQSGFYTMTASVIAEVGTVVLRGEWHGQMGQISTNEQAGFTNSASKKAFAELQAVAEAYPGDK